MAVPKLARPKPFLRLDPARLAGSPVRGATIRGAFQYGEPASPEELPHVDLVVCGSVAVDLDRAGARVGKGGYSDLELALLRELGRVDDEMVVATTLHPLQVLEGPLPETEHDFRVGPHRHP